MINNKREFFKMLFKYIANSYKLLENLLFILKMIASKIGKKHFFPPNIIFIGCHSYQLLGDIQNVGELCPLFTPMG